MFLKYPRVLVFTLFFVFSVSAQKCHYSCNTCSDTFYTHCYSCQDGSTLTPVNTVSNIPVGLCGTPASTSINGMGVFLLLVIIASGLFLKSQHVFYFILSMQTLGLLSLM